MHPRSKQIQNSDFSENFLWKSYLWIFFVTDLNFSTSTNPKNSRKSVEIAFQISKLVHAILSVLWHLWGWNLLEPYFFATQNICANPQPYCWGSSFKLVDFDVEFLLSCIPLSNLNFFRFIIDVYLGPWWTKLSWSDEKVYYCDGLLQYDISGRSLPLKRLFDYITLMTRIRF